MPQNDRKFGRVITFSTIFHFLIPGKIKTHLADFFSNRAIRILVVTNGLVLIAGAMLAPIYAAYVDIIGGDLMDASFAGGAFALTAGTTVLLAGKFSDRGRAQELVVVTGYIDRYGIFTLHFSRIRYFSFFRTGFNLF